MAIYQARIEIDESFRDLKSLLSMDKVMNKKQRNMEKMIAMELISCTIGYLVGESIRDLVYGFEEEPGEKDGRADSYPAGPRRQKRSLYSGLFILLKQKIDLAVET